MNALNIKKDQLIYTFQSWGPKYKVELDITFWKQYGDWQNVFHFTTDGNCCNLGQRIPFLGVLSNTFRIGSAVNDNVNYEIDFNFELGKYYNIIIEQYEDQENIWKYQIKINGECSSFAIIRRSCLSYLVFFVWTVIKIFSVFIK